ncbi:MAG TPA: hypothetical protein VJ907_04670 [Halanaerobiales bacterium]|nr:hypothetical protein [Halanaerobiales bacterium]
MNIVFIASGPHDFLNGCYHDRMYAPSNELKECGHETRTLFLRSQVSQKWLDYADVVVFARYYNHQNALPLLYSFRENDTKIVYDIDDDIWTVPGVNPTQNISRKNKRQAEELMEQSDLITTSTPILKKRIEDKMDTDKVVVCPNGVRDNFKGKEKENDILRIGWSGSVTHWGDLMLVLPALKELQEDYEFKFYLQGICSQPLIAEFYRYQLEINLGSEERFHKKAMEAREVLSEMDFEHIPFYPPEMHPEIMKDINLDIGLCPLENNYFNAAKSNMKFYQYAWLGATTLASDVAPYNTEMEALVKNTKKDWKNKIEELIKNEKKRKDLLKKQRKFVKENRRIKDVVEKTWNKHLKNLIEKG